MVDQWTGFSTATDTYDGVHPNAAGDQKISDRWFPALTAALGTTTPPVDTTPPSAPGTPTISSTCTSVTTQSWAASTDNVGVAGYDIFRATGASGGTFAAVGTSTTTSFTNTGLTPVTTYRFQVRARDAAGNASPFTSPILVTTPNCDAVAPTTPGHAHGDQRQLELHHPQLDRVDRQRRRSPATRSTGRRAPPAARSPRSARRARPRSATSACRPAPPTATRSGPVTPPATCRPSPARSRSPPRRARARHPPTTPGTPTASNVTANSVTLDLDRVHRVVRPGRLRRAAAPRAPAAARSSWSVRPHAPPFINTGLSPATTYRYQVRARDAAGNASAVSAAVTVTTQSGGDAPAAARPRYRQTNSWGGGFQGEVTVTNTGTTPTSSWTVTMTFANGQRITQIWGARTTQTASPYTITNESWNALLVAVAVHRVRVPRQLDRHQHRPHRHLHPHPVGPPFAPVPALGQVDRGVTPAPRESLLDRAWEVTVRPGGRTGTWSR